MKNKKVILIISGLAILFMLSICLVIYVYISYAKGEVKKYSKEDVTYHSIIATTENHIMIRFNQELKALNMNFTWGYNINNGKVYMSPTEDATMLFVVDKPIDSKK